MAAVPAGIEGSATVAAAMAAAGRAVVMGLPQSMQNREAGSLAAPQKLHVVMQAPEAGKVAWAANIRLGHGARQRRGAGRAERLRNPTTISE
jgi:hypothetical protein